MATATFTWTQTTAGTYTWVCPAGVTAAQIQCWGSGGGGGGSGGSPNFTGAGGGGGEYAAEPTLSVTAGSSYTVVVGAAGAAGASNANGGAGNSSTFASTSVVAHGGSGGPGNVSGTAGGAGGTGSSNTTHFSGGQGGTSSTNSTNGGGGGGGSSGGTASAGNTGGAAGSGTTGGAAGTAVTGGGIGAVGGNDTAVGNAPVSGPGGGGGGGGASVKAGGAGFAGKVVITVTITSPALFTAADSAWQFVAPSGITTVLAECWGAGAGGGGSTSPSRPSGGGGGGEYANEPALAVTSGNSYAFTIGAPGAGGTAGDHAGGAGSNSTMSGDSATVTAHGGSGGAGANSSTAGTGGAGGTGSSNTTHFGGGAGGTSTGAAGVAGAGGGGSGGSAAGGNAGSAGSGSTGGAGGTAVTGGGPGGVGSNLTLAGLAPTSGPGGGGGGGSEGTTPAAGGAGFAGQVQITFAGNVTSTGSVALAPMKMAGTGAVANPITSTGSLAMAPMALSGSANNGVIGSTGSMAMAPMGFAGSGLAGVIGTGSLAMAPMALHATDIEDFNATGSVALAPMAMSGTGYQALPFPLSPLRLLVELLINGTWVDISADVYQRDNIIITRGRPNEATSGTTAPSSMTLTLNNRSGNYSSRNPLGIYYGYLGRNSQIRLSGPTDPIQAELAYRFWGVVSAWPPSWDATGSDVYISITANGVLRRLGQAAVLHSALYRYYSMLADTAVPLAYWPMEDGATSTTLASGIAGGFPMTFTGLPTLAGDSGFPASAAVPSIASAVFTGPTGVSGALPVANQAVFSTAGSGEWVCPAGITSAVVECWGAGGAGSGYNGSTGGAGGGGGEYASGTVALTPGTSYAYTVGTGGSSGPGGSSHFTGNSSFEVLAHGGGYDATGATGGAGGTGSSNAVAYAGGAGAPGSGGPGGGGSETQQSQGFTSSSTWTAPSNLTGSVQVQVYGGGGGGGISGDSHGAGGGGGGGFSSGSGSASPNGNYTVTVGTGGSGATTTSNSTAGGSSSALGVSAGGGSRGLDSGDAASGGSGDYTGGAGGTATSGAGGGGGGGGAGPSGGGGQGTDSDGGGSGGNGGAGSSGGNGGQGGTSGDYSGSSGGPPGGGGGGGYENPSDTTGRGGGAGARGYAELYWYETGSSPAAAVGGGGGSSGGSASVGNAGATEAGGAAVTGGGPGGGTLTGSIFNASPLATPGGGGGGYDSLGGPANGAAGLVRITYAVSGSGSGIAANVTRFLLNVGASGDADGAVIVRTYTTGPIAWYDVAYNATDQIVLAATGSPATNPNANPVQVTVAGGTITEIAVGGVNTGLTSGVVTVPGGGTITVTYSAAPTTFTTAAVPGTGGCLTLTGYGPAGTTLFTTGQVAFGVDGLYVLVSAELQSVSGNVTYNLTALECGDTEPITSSGSTYLGGTLGDPFDAVIDPNANLASSAVGHLAILETYDPVTDLAGPAGGYAGENAADRFTRLCTEEGISSSIVGTDTDTELMGPQTIQQLVALLQECEDADRGLLYEDRNSLGLVYRTRADLYNQNPAVTLNYTSADLAQPIQPTEDDQLTRNDVTATRTSGSSYEAVVTTGALSVSDPEDNPPGVGVYTFSQTVNVQSDGQLPNVASWIAYIGTVDQLRYPVLTLDLSRQQSGDYFDDIVAADIGDYATVQNPPYWLPPGTIDQLIYGATETLNAYVFTIAMNCVPEDPYEVAQAADSQCDTDGSTLHQGIGTGDTQFYVDTPPPNARWVDLATYPSNFPIAIIVAGEVMTVTEIDGTSTPQLFTVLRSANGIQKAHNAGEPVNVYQPAVVAL